jgi:hypothetical protein
MVRAFSLNAQPATRNFQLACFEFAATHLVWVVKAVFSSRHSPLAIRHPLPFRLADLPISRFAENLARQEPRPPIFPPLVPFRSCPVPHIPFNRAS